MKRFFAIVLTAAALALFATAPTASAADHHRGHGGYHAGHSSNGHGAYKHRGVKYGKSSHGYHNNRRGSIHSHAPRYKYGPYPRGYSSRYRGVPSGYRGYIPSYRHGGGVHLDIGRFHLGIGNHH